MPQILELQEFETEAGPDETGVADWSTLSVGACGSDLSLIC